MENAFEVQILRRSSFSSLNLFYTQKSKKMSGSYDFDDAFPTDENCGKPERKEKRSVKSENLEGFSGENECKH